jgi:Flp pilus assembly protein CpaB
VVLAAALAFATNLMVLRNQDETRQVAVAATDLAAGRPVAIGHFRAVEVDVSDELFLTLVPWAQVANLVGSVPAHPLPAGELIRASDLRDPSASAGLRSMSIPIDAEHAVGGDVSPGDRIDLILVQDEGATYVLVGAEVMAVSDSARGALSVDSFHITVAVDARQALAVASAIRDGRIEVVRSTGAAVSPDEVTG